MPNNMDLFLKYWVFTIDTHSQKCPGLSFIHFTILSKVYPEHTKTWIWLIYGFLKAETYFFYCCLRLTNTRTDQKYPISINYVVRRINICQGHQGMCLGLILIVVWGLDKTSCPFHVCFNHSKLCQTQLYCPRLMGLPFNPSNSYRVPSTSK